MDRFQSHQNSFRSELMDELRQLRLGSKSVVGFSGAGPPPNLSSSSPILGSSPASLSIPSSPMGSTVVDTSVLPLYSAYMNGSLHNQQLINSSSAFTLPMIDWGGFTRHDADPRMYGDPRLFMDPRLVNNPIFGLDPYYFTHIHGDVGSRLHSQPMTQQNNTTMTNTTIGEHNQVMTSGIGYSTASNTLSPSHSLPSFPMPTAPTYSTIPTVHPQLLSQHYPQPSLQYHSFHPYNSHGWSPNQSHTPQHDPTLPTMKQIRLDFPVFGGEDPVEWINKAEQYFQLYQIPEARKISIAPIYLIGIAASLWQLHLQDNPSSWSALKDLMLKQFGGYNKLDYQAALAKMQQVGSVTEYRDQFTKMSCRAPGFSPELRLACFLGGLKEEIRTDVSVMKPSSLMEAYDLALSYEKRHNAQRGVRPNQLRSQTHPIQSTNRFAGTSFSRPTQISQVQPRRFSHDTSQPDRHYSQAEYRERRAKNQCFFCDEEYHKGHVCKKGARALHIEGSPLLNDQLEELQTEETIGDLLTGDFEEAPLISLHVMTTSSLSDTEKSDTMQFKGVIGRSKEVHILVDSGATHNFIHPYLVKFTSGIVSKAAPLLVRVASGEKMKTQGFIPSLQVQVQGYTLEADCYILPVSGCELVLGTAWLKSLGDVLCNWEKQTMKYWKRDVVHQLQGVISNDVEMITFKQMTSLLTKEREGILIEIQQVNEVKLPTDIHPQIKELLAQFADIFDTPTTLPPPRLHDHKIPLMPGAAPVNNRPYRYPYFQKSEIEKIVTEQLAAGIIQPSVSPFSSPVLLVKKKDGTSRMCVDYRSLNAITVKDKFPIPVVDELLDEVGGSVYFTKLDLRSGYHQIRMEKVDVHKTAFRTHDGHYEFLVMPFGLTNAPSTFQSLMNDVFRDMLRKFVLVFFDDILIYSLSLEQHLHHLSAVFKRLQEHELKVKMSKCAFGVKSVEYLGHIISDQGVAVDPNKIKSIAQWEQPKTLKGLRGFLGLAGYYRKFVQNFGVIAQPLTAMLKKDGFKWSPAAEKAFEDLKIALCTTPVLALPNFSKEFTIECDASDVGIGAVLSQDSHPIAFLSKVLALRHQAMSVYDKEMLAVVSAVQQWRPYLIGHHFKIVTDHRSIQHFFKPKNHHSYATKVVA